MLKRLDDMAHNQGSAFPQSSIKLSGLVELGIIHFVKGGRFGKSISGIAIESLSAISHRVLAAFEK